MSLDFKRLNYDSYAKDITYQWESIKRKTVCLVVVTFKGRGVKRPWHILLLGMTETNHGIYLIFQVTYSLKFLLSLIVITFVTSALISFTQFPYFFLNFIALLIFSRQVASSIPDGVIGIFQWHNPSGRTMTLGLTQPLTEMSTRRISWE